MEKKQTIPQTCLFGYCALCDVDYGLSSAHKINRNRNKMSMQLAHHGLA